MFTRFSIGQILIVIAVLALVFAALGTGMSTGDSFARGMVYAMLTVPFMFLFYGLVFLLLRLLAPIGGAVFGSANNGDGPKFSAPPVQKMPPQTEQAKIE